MIPANSRGTADGSMIGSNVNVGNRGYDGKAYDNKRKNKDTQNRIDVALNTGLITNRYHSHVPRSYAGSTVGSNIDRDEYYESDARGSSEERSERRKRSFREA